MMADVLRTRLFWVGLLGVTIGFLVPFLQLLDVLPLGMALSMFGWVCSVGGLFLGIMSAARAYRTRPPDEPDDTAWFRE
jgi:hypothetical protein